MKARAFACSVFFCATCSLAVVGQLQITAVTNSADFKPGLPQKGSLASIFLTGLQGQPGVYVNTQNPLLNTFVAEVWINFMPAPVLAVAFENGYQQINMQIPWQGERDPLYVEVFQGGNRAHFETAYTNNGFYPSPSSGWSALFVDATGHAIVQHASDYSLVTPDNPAHAEENVIAYAINLGPVTNTPSSGHRAPSNPLAIFDPAAINSSVCGGSDIVMIGNTQARPDYDGLAPGLVGIYQVNFKVPAGISGEVPLAIQRTLTQSFMPQCSPGEANPPLIETTTSASALINVR